MREFKVTTVASVPYLYVDKSCGMDPDDVGAAMGEAFNEVYGFIQEQGIKSAGHGLSVYYTYDENKMDFRAGFVVSRADAAKATGNVKADVTPNGKALMFTHIGPYSELRDSYAEMMAHIAEAGLEIGAPTWEFYISDPSVVPAADLQTDVYVTLV